MIFMWRIEDKFYETGLRGKRPASFMFLLYTN